MGFSLLPSLAIAYLLSGRPTGTGDRLAASPATARRRHVFGGSLNRIPAAASGSAVPLVQSSASGARSTGPTAVTPAMDRAPTCRHATPHLAQRSACAVPVSPLDPTCSRGGSVTRGAPTCRGCAEGSAPRCLRTTLGNQTGFLAAPRRHSRTINRCTQPGNLGTQPASWQGLPARRRQQEYDLRLESSPDPAVREKREIRPGEGDQARQVPLAPSIDRGQNRRLVWRPGLAPRCRPPSRVLPEHSSRSPNP